MVMTAMAMLGIQPHYHLFKISCSESEPSPKMTGSVPPQRTRTHSPPRVKHPTSQTNPTYPLANLDRDLQCLDLFEASVFLFLSPSLCWKNSGPFALRPKGSYTLLPLRWTTSSAGCRDRTGARERWFRWLCGMRTG